MWMLPYETFIFHMKQKKMGKLKFYSQIFIINQLLKMNFMLDLYF